MTIIENNSPKQIYIGPFSKDTPIPLTFPYISKHHVHAMMNDIEIIQPSDFEVIENSIKLTADWPKDSTLTVYRITTLDQQSPFPQQSKFRSERIEQALDKLCMQNQEQEEQLGRTVKVPISKKTFDGTMPYPVPGRTLKINSDASGFELSELDVDDAYAQTNQYKVEAQLARDEATNQANIATSQAGIATDKANASANSATQAAETLAVAVTTITTEKEEAVEAVQNQQVNSINAVKSQQNTSVNALKAEGTTQVNLAKAEVTKATTQANNAANSASQAANTLAAAQTTINTEKTNAVKAVQNQQTGSVNTVKSTGQSYIDKCKAWASSDRIVEGGLYSAKHYAEMAQGKSDVTYEHLRASRVYNDKGMLLTDEEGYAEVAEMNRTFDLSKFAIVGTPSITDDGIASECNSSNYVNTRYVWSPSNNSWEIRIKCTTPSTLPSPFPAMLMGSSTKADIKVPRIGIQQNGKWIWSIPNDTGTKWQKEYWGTLDVAKLNTDYYFKMYFTGTEYKLDYSFDNKTWNNMATYQSTMLVYNLGAPIGLGGDLISYVWSGSIDLKHFSITVDGKEVFNGNKSGLDIVKPDNYAVVGSPTITSDGILKPLYIENSIPLSCVQTTGFRLEQLLNKRHKIEGSFILEFPTGRNSAGLFSCGQTLPWISWSNSFYISQNNLFIQGRFGTASDDTKNVDIASLSKTSLLSYIGKKITYLVEFNGIDTYTYKLLDSDRTEIFSKQYVPTSEDKNLYSATLYPQETINIGDGHQASNKSYASTLKIDLNSFKIYVDDELVYQPCLKIPYNLSENGAKVVPAYARDRVLDVYENNDKGYAYYTIDEENRNFTLPLGTTFDNSVRRNLENITENGNEKLATSLMYETGNVSNDVKGFNQLAKMNKSTFDLSKFTIVGTPTITDDGVVSGLLGSNSSYLRTNYKTENLKNKSWKIKVKFKTGTVTDAGAQFTPIINFTNRPNDNYQAFGSISQWMHTLVFSARTGISTDSNNEGAKINLSYVLEENKDYSATLEYNHNTGTYILKAYDSNGLLLREGTWIAPTTQSNTELWGINNATSDNYLCIGATKEGKPFLGSIDLKEFFVDIDDKEVFNGNKTGLDVIKPDNYTIVGSPTISDDAVASGFTTADYIKTSIIIPPASEIKVTGRFTMPESAFEDRAEIFHYGDTESNRIWLQIEYGNKLQLSGGEGRNRATATNRLDYGATYDYECIFNGSNLLTLKFKKIEDNDFTIVTANQTGTIGNTTLTDLYFGIYSNKALPFKAGSIDLNSFKIYVDGNLVYQPCLKIPYNISKTGSKIVHAYARERVIDLYEQEGHAGYYTIDEEKKNFTLPMGEIFGLIGQRSLRSVTRDGANYCEIYSDKTIEQGGTCTANVEVTLQQPFADTNYVLSVPYSSKTATSFIPTQTGDWIAKGKGV